MKSTPMVPHGRAIAERAPTDCWLLPREHLLDLIAHESITDTFAPFMLLLEQLDKPPPPRLPRSEADDSPQRSGLPTTNFHDNRRMQRGVLANLSGPRSKLARGSPPQPRLASAPPARGGALPALRHSPAKRAKG